jgi:hypothetical protein
VTAATANRLHVILSALEIKPRDVTWFININWVSI